MDSEVLCNGNPMWERTMSRARSGMRGKSPVRSKSPVRPLCSPQGTTVGNPSQVPTLLRLVLKRRTDGNLERPYGEHGRNRVVPPGSYVGTVEDRAELCSPRKCSILRPVTLDTESMKSAAEFPKSRLGKSPINKRGRGYIPELDDEEDDPHERHMRMMLNCADPLKGDVDFNIEDALSVMEGIECLLRDPDETAVVPENNRTRAATCGFSLYPWKVATNMPIDMEA